MRLEMLLGAAAVTGVMAVSACGGSGAESGYSGGEREAASAMEAPTSPVNRTGGDSISAVMGAAGGRLELSNGARIEIPPGTFQQATEVMLKVAQRTTAFKDADVRGDKPVGPLVLVTPEMYAPEGGKLVFSIPFNAFPEGFSEKGLYIAAEEVSQQQRQFAEDTVVTRWDYDRARLSGGRAVAELGALSGMRLQFILSRE